MILSAVALLKQDWENHLFHIFGCEHGSDAQPKVQQKSWNSRLKISAIPTKWHRFSESERRLLVHHFDLLVDYLTGEPIDCNMHPIALLTLYHELDEIGLPLRIITTLRDDIN